MMQNGPSKAPLTVLQVIPAMDTGGAEIICQRVAEALVAAGHRAIVASSGGRMVPALERAGVTHVTLPLASKAPWVMARNLARLAKLAKTEGAHMIHAHSRAPAWSAWGAARQTRLPFLTTYHSGYSEPNRLKRFYNSVMARGDRVIAVSHHMAHLIRTRYGTPEGRIRVIHVGIDPQKFDPETVTPAARMALREKWGVPSNSRIILLPGRLARRKGQAVLVQAMAMLREKGTQDVIALLVGDGERNPRYLAEIRQIIAEKGLAPWVRHVGHCTDMVTAYAIADVSLCISSAEGFPTVALEAQAMGVPVIVSDIGPGREVAATPPDVPLDEATGLRVPFGDATALAQALETFFAMPEAKRRAMGARGAERVRDTYTIQGLCEKTLALYHEVVSDFAGKG